MEFKKGQFKEAMAILFYDLSELATCRTNKKDFDYHFALLKGNLSDLYGRDEKDYIKRKKVKGLKE